MMVETDICRNCSGRGVESLLSLDETYFWYGPKTEFLEQNVGDRFFRADLQLCPECGLLGLPVDKRLKKILDTVYTSPNSVPGATPGEASAYSRTLANIFFKAFSRLVPQDNLPEKVLEIGCQQGYLLHKLKELGIKQVTGVEPGDIPAYKSPEGNTEIDIKRGYFSKDLVGNETFDFIFSLQVFEHIEQPGQFLRSAREMLTPKGRLLLAVPNELFSLQSGNIGMIFFQHVNYFTPVLLSNLLKQNGFKIVNVISERTLPLYVMAEPAGNPETLDTSEDIRRMVKDYGQKLKTALNRIESAFSDKKEDAIGFYGVNCALGNIFSWVPGLKEIRPQVFDSDSGKWGKAFGGVPGTVLPPAEINRVRQIIPVPYRLQDIITRYIRTLGAQDLEILKLYE